VELGQVLGALPPIVDPNVINAAAARDDAAVYRIAANRALVATVDFFTPIVDDPTAYGAIAAANAVSDIYAVGAKPLFALGITAFPRAKLSAGLLEKIVSGGAAKLAEVGVPVVGGHSVDDEEPKFGYAVIGEVNPKRMVGHDGAAAGDVLFLTKPLGSGLVATAIKRGLATAEVEAAAIDVMTALNREASEAMLKAHATAATDVTGYGLIGHLANLVGGADVEFDSVPFIKGAGNLADRDLFPDGSRRNYAAFRDRVEWGGLGETERMMLCDAQTSGGLLVAIPPRHANRFKHGQKIGVMRGDGVIRVHG
jgi:selenide,water dikinase